MSHKKLSITISNNILRSATEIGQLIGSIDAVNLDMPTVELRRFNQIKTIQSSLAIEGNTLSLE